MACRYRIFPPIPDASLRPRPSRTSLDFLRRRRLTLCRRVARPQMDLTWGRNTALTHFQNVNALRTFTLAAQSLSFTAAGRELNISTSAVSHQVRTLEEYLGLRLFLREPKQLVLTPEGEYLFRQLNLP